MDYNLSLKIFNVIETSSLQKLKHDLYESAVSYTNIRVEWLFADLEKKNTLDQQRTSSHNVFIDCCNILSRNMSKLGEDNSWRGELGNDRKTIGDFACYLVSILGIKAR
jgi:hypothetical protein